MTHRKLILTAACMLAAAIVGIAADGSSDSKTATGSSYDERRRFVGERSIQNPPPPVKYRPGPNPPYPPPYNPYPGGAGYSNSSYKPSYTQSYGNKWSTFVPTYPIPIQGTRNGEDPCDIVNPNCTCPDSPYRTYDGTCNNLFNSSRGSAGTPLVRVLPPRYDDSGAPIEKTAAGSLPLSRVVSETLYKDKNRPDPYIARSFTDWGQMMAHDGSRITDRVPGDGEHYVCCTDDGQLPPPDQLDENCFPSKIPYDDPYYARYYRGCMSLVRSELFSPEDCSDPEQISYATHFMDLSVIYGNNFEENYKLRTLERGQLKVKELYGPYGGTPRIFMPNVDDPTKECGAYSDNDICYLAGDPRVNENPALTAMHILWVREHNRVADGLYDMHSMWSDQLLFEEARRIVVAEWQYFIYKYWFPIILGNTVMEETGISMSYEGFDTVYDPDANPSTMNEFTTAAFRIIHSMVTSRIDFDGEGRCPMKREWLSDLYFKPGILEKGDNFDSIVRGATTQSAQQLDSYTTKEINKLLFKGYKPYGDDLSTIDIQRGRDHGMPGYNDVREICGLPRAYDFDDFSDVMHKKDIHKLKNLYNSPDDVDLISGASLEKPGVNGDYYAIVGPTAGCLIAEQAWRWRFGDRYFFDCQDCPGAFTEDQVNAIKKTSFAGLLCENMDYVKYMQYNAFRTIYEGNELYDCNDVERLDLKPWKYYQPSLPECYETETEMPY